MASFQSDEGRGAILASLVEFIAQRREYAAGLSNPPLNIPAAKHAELGRDVLQGRLSQLLSTTSEECPALDVGEAFDAFVVALAHFSVADGRRWAVTSIRLGTISGDQLHMLADQRQEP